LLVDRDPEEARKILDPLLERELMHITRVVCKAVGSTRCRRQTIAHLIFCTRTQLVSVRGGLNGTAR